MRDASTAFAASISGAHKPVIRISSWLGDQLLVDELPVVPGTWQVTDDDDAQVHAQLAFQVPNVPEWRPTSPDHPLNNLGQEVNVAAGIELAGSPELLPLGIFRILACRPNDDVLDVTAACRMVNIERYRFLQPFDVTVGASRAATLAKITQGVIPLSVEVADQTTAAATWEESRIDAVQEIVDGWGARYYVDETGVLVIAPAWSDVLDAPVVELVDGPGGTLLDVTPDEMVDDDESGRFNAYKVSTVPEGDEAPVSATAYLESGPMRWGGPYGYRPGFFASPLLKADVAELQQVAKSLVERSRRRTETVTFTAGPDPRVEVGDVARLRSSSAGLDLTARITKVQHTRSGLTGTAAYTGSAVT